MAAAIPMMALLALLPTQVTSARDHDGNDNRDNHDRRDSRDHRDVGRRGHEDRRYHVYSPPVFYYPGERSPGLDLFIPFDRR